MKRNLAPIRTLVRELIPVVGSFAPGGGSLPYDGQSGNFTVGLVLTGGTSGATATIAADTDDGTSGVLTLVNIVGAFEDDEAITDSSTGAADAAGDLAEGADAPTTFKGLGYTVVRTSAGLYTITFTNQYQSLVSVKAMFQSVTGVDQYVQVGSVSLANKTAQIRVWDLSGAAVADPFPDANTRIHFVAYFRDSAALPEFG